ncbi:putative mitochondrial protein [Nicotiana attenuata]|uniref:Mitochondrial protein n=1 Tax=Nicotiana attenuata TaxID=49451 RepID=A0A1J6K511_NICAT|nr:putative mitochondrial protein [Nicotiana attenuata]
MYTRWTYLGLPAVVDRSKKDLLSFIKERILSKIKCWKGKFLSQAGKEILLKSFLAPLPSYALSCFQLPDGLCKEITSLFVKFWWGHIEEKQKLHIERWDKLCEPKFRGGLGFRDLKAFNMDLLAKLAWRILIEPNLLASQVLKSKYFPDKSLLQAQVSNFASWIWKSILWGRDLLCKGVRWCVSYGTDVNVW